RAERPPALAPARVKPPRSFPSVSIEPLDYHVKISGPSVDVREIGDTAVVSLTFTVASNWELPRPARLNIGVPRDANVVGMSATAGDETYHGISELAVNAREEFEHLILK